MSKTCIHTYILYTEAHFKIILVFLFLFGQNKLGVI